MTRVVQLAVPRYADEAMITQLADDIEAMLSTWTKKSISIHEPLKYDNLNQALSTLQRQAPGYVLFVFENRDPATYDTVARELNEWRVKRITFSTLQNRFALLIRGKKEKWQSFIDLSALDILQQMECVPWVIATPLHYEARIAINVGWDRRHFALSLLICRQDSILPSFWLDTVVEFKADPKCETINHIHLKDKLIALVQRAACGKRFDPLRSVLVLRDGRECGHELEAIDTAKSELINMGLFIPDVRVDAIDVYKKSLKGIRYWERNNNGDVRNVLEGTALFIDGKTVLIANTGAATLHQGTADPLILVARLGNMDMDRP